MNGTRKWKSGAWFVSVVAIAGIGLGGCPEDDDGHDHEHDGGDMDYAAAECPASTPETRVGLIAEGNNGVMQAELLEADDLPPLKKPNHWVIEIQDLDGEPVEDAEIELKLFMPVHNHDGLRDPEVTALGGGKFDLDDMNLWMLGPWEIQIAVNGDEEMIVFHTCVE